MIPVFFFSGDGVILIHSAGLLRKAKGLFGDAEPSPVDSGEEINISAGTGGGAARDSAFLTTTSDCDCD